MINFRNTKFIKSALSKNDHLLDYPHILFIGKSNVGKSSLINALVDQKNLAYVSKTPGQTKLVNYYLVDNKFYLVDVPGFGYRKLAYEKDLFEEMMDDYLKNNGSLKAVFYLLDSRREITDDEIDVIKYFQDMNYQVELIFTKEDKLKQAEKAKILKNIKLYNFENDYLFASINKPNLLNKIQEKIVSYLE